MSNQSNFDQERFNSLRDKIMDRSDRDGINPSKVLASIKKWSDNQLDLFEIIVNLFDNSEKKLEKGRESEQIDEIVRINIIEDWRNNKAGEYLIEIERKILKSTNSHALLNTYRKLLEKESIAYRIDSQIYKTLLDYGLISRHDNQLTIANEIYRTVFNIEWIDQHCNNPTSATTTNTKFTIHTVPENRIKTDNRASNMSRILSLLSLSLLPIFIILINYTGGSKNPAPSPNSGIDANCKKNLKEIEQILKQELSSGQENLILGYSGDQIYWQEKDDLKTCQSDVEDLLITNYAPAAASGQTEQAIKFLCLIRNRGEDYSGFFGAAQKQLNEWYDPKDSSNLRSKVDEHIKGLKRDLPEACPAAPPELLEKYKSSQ